MVVQILAGAAYTWVQHTWTVSTWIIQFLLIAFAAKVFYDETPTLQHYFETLIEYSRPTVAAVSLMGVGAALTGFAAEPPLLLVSQLLALGYYGLLFWRF